MQYRIDSTVFILDKGLRLDDDGTVESLSEFVIYFRLRFRMCVNELWEWAREEREDNASVLVEHRLIWITEGSTLQEGPNPERRKRTKMILEIYSFKSINCK